MIGIILMGGLGNQLFQLALALHLRQIGRDVALDLTPLCRRALEAPARSYALDALHHGVPIMTSYERWFWGHDAPILRRLQSWRDAKRPWEERRLRIERMPFRFDADAPGLHPGRVMGYWQHPGYVNRVGDELRSLLSLPLPSPSKAATISQQMLNMGIRLGIQVRRGDLATNDRTREFHGLCPADYYRRGREFVESRTGRGPCLFVSDDPAWCRMHLAGSDDLVAEHQSGDLADLQLLGRCQHHVIANSTFGWWGAWLGRRQGSVTVAPLPWLESDNLADPLPSDWERIRR